MFILIVKIFVHLCSCCQRGPPDGCTFLTMARLPRVGFHLLLECGMSHAGVWLVKN